MYHIFEIRLFFLINFKKIYHYRTHRSLKSVKQYGLTHFVSGWFLVFFCFFFNSFLLLQDMEKNIFKTLTATLSSSYLHPLPHLTSTLSPSHRHPLLILPPPIWWWSVPFTLHAEHFPIQGRGSFLIQKQFLKRFVEIFCSLWDLYWEDMVPKHIPPHTTFTYRKWLMVPIFHKIICKHIPQKGKSLYVLPKGKFICMLKGKFCVASFWFLPNVILFVFFSFTPALKVLVSAKISIFFPEMYAHRGKKVQLLVFWDRPRNGRHLVNYRHCLRGLPNRH